MLLALLAAATLAADLQQLAKLPGEPSIVSAAGIAADDSPVLTLENASAFDTASTARRVVIVATPGSDDRATDAVLQLVRWMKTDAPKDIRAHWRISALPAGQPIDNQSFDRWIRFQAPDFVVSVGEGRGVPGVHRWTPQEFEAALRRVPGIRGQDYQIIADRVSRDPLAIATLLASKYPGTPAISYIPSVAWANTLKVAELTRDASLRAKVEGQTAQWRGGQDLFGTRIQLTSVAGTFVFSELGAADVVAKGVDAASKVKDGDVYEYGQGWTDDMFMATVVLARNGRTDLAARMLVAYAARLQRPDGIFNHATNGPAAWGRGNGFAALGLVEALSAMPGTDPNRARVLEIYRRQMDAVRKLQAPDGMWNEVLDEPGSYREESATAMLMTAMSRGIRAGWLDPSFAAFVERAWRGVAAHVDMDGNIVDVCTSTGSGPTKRYYLDRAAVTGADDRGGAMALMAAVEVHTLRQTARPRRAGR